MTRHAHQGRAVGRRAGPDDGDRQPDGRDRRDHPGDQPDVDGDLQVPGRGEGGQHHRACAAPAGRAVLHAHGRGAWPRPPNGPVRPRVCIGCLERASIAATGELMRAPRRRAGAGHRRPGDGARRLQQRQADARGRCRQRAGLHPPQRADVGRGRRDDRHLQVFRQRHGLRCRAVGGARRADRRRRAGGVPAARRCFLSTPNSSSAWPQLLFDEPRRARPEDVGQSAVELARRIGADACPPAPGCSVRELDRGRPRRPRCRPRSSGPVLSFYRAARPARPGIAALPRDPRPSAARATPWASTADDQEAIARLTDLPASRMPVNTPSLFGGMGLQHRHRTRRSCSAPAPGAARSPRTTSARCT